MTYHDFIKLAAKDNGYSQVATKDILDSCWETVKKILVEGEELTIPGFIKFDSVQVPDREYRNPTTGEKFIKKSHAKPRVKLSSVIKRDMEAMA